MDSNQLLERLSVTLERIEARLPPIREVADWSAIAFRYRHGLQSVAHPRLQNLQDLHCIEQQKQILTDNTHNFVERRPANNALLWGSRGTGKSSLVRAMLSEFSDRGLRLIEVDRNDLMHLPEIVEPLFDRAERFLLYCDDLSFDADEPGYKALKATLDGSIAETPENVLLYATSNRRHLLPEYLDENQQAQNVDGEIHHGDAVEEKNSLSERFGLLLAFHPFTQEQYLKIVASELDQYGLPLEPASSEALRYALQRGSRSGRVAAQFAVLWAGKNQQP